MSLLCLAAAAVLTTLPAPAFTLSWTHSIEKIRWEEDYRIDGGRLQMVEARIRGSGAGMEPPEGAVLRNGVWHYRPALGTVAQLDLARSGFVDDYALCWDGRCHPMATLAGSPADSPRVVLAPCPW
jgi:hypothetical protein